MAGEGDKGYLLTSIAHTATDQSRPGEPVTFTFTVTIEPSATEPVHTPRSLLFSFHCEPAVQGGVRKGGWITDVTHNSEGLSGQSTVATETLTIPHEGLLLV